MTDSIDINILLVEDTTTDAEMTTRVLRKRGVASNLVWVKDGSEALDLLFRTGTFANRTGSQPKLILLDVKMPKVDGIEVLRRIKQDDILRLIPVVMLTSSAEEPDIVECYKLGANSYIVKPVDSEQFDRLIGDAGIYWMHVNKFPG